MNRARVTRALRELASAALVIADELEPLEGAPDATPMDKGQFEEALRQVQLIALCSHLTEAFASPSTERKPGNA